VETNLLLLSHSSESQMSPVTNVACLEFVDVAGGPRNLVVALCIRKYSLVLDSG
jgi:hypothetical protein